MSEVQQHPPDTSRRNSPPLFNLSGIVVGTVVGSLAAGIVMIYLNYRSLDRTRLANTVALWGSVVFLVLLIATAFIPTTLPSALLFTVIQAGLAWFLADRLQGEVIRYHQAHGGPIHSTFRAVLVGFLTGLAAFLLVGFVSALVLTLSGNLPTAPPA